MAPRGCITATPAICRISPWCSHGTRPILLSSTIRDDNAGATCDLTNPDLIEDERLLLAHDRLHLRRSRFLWRAACYERIAVRSFADQPLELMLELRFAADFVDLFEVRGQRRPRRGASMRR